MTNLGKKRVVRRKKRFSRNKMGMSSGLGGRSATTPHSGLSFLMRNADTGCPHYFTRTSSLIQTKRCTKNLALLRMVIPVSYPANRLRQKRGIDQRTKVIKHAIEGGRVALQTLHSFVEDQPQRFGSDSDAFTSELWNELHTLALSMAQYHANLAGSF